MAINMVNTLNAVNTFDRSIAFQLASTMGVVGKDCNVLDFEPFLR